MYNYQKKLKNQKKKKLKQIKTSNEYLFFCRYYDFKSEDVINLKKYLKDKQINFKVFKRSIINKEINELKSQGPIIIFYFNDVEKLKILYDFLKSFPTIEPLFLKNNGILFSILKIKKILKNDVLLPYQLKKSIYNIYQLFLNIK